MGIALLITALLMLGKQRGLMAFLGTGNTAMGLEGVKLIVAIVLNLIFGALMTIGCGFVCTLHGNGLSARLESYRSIPCNDGFLRSFDARCI